VFHRSSFVNTGSHKRAFTKSGWDLDGFPV
jgi:hypothetical protein